MGHDHRITVDGQSFVARRGQLLLDAALANGVDLPFDCRAGHCGTCCVRLAAGRVHGGEGAEPGIVHACQCRVIGDAVVERLHTGSTATVDGVVSSLRALSNDVVEVGIATERALPHHAGQYAQLQFRGFESRPFSFTHPLSDEAERNNLWFHMRRMKGGQVTSALGRRIRPGHRVQLAGPFGSAHFRPNLRSRMVLVATNTGFAPIWSIAVAALREDPERPMMIIAGARSLQSLYMAPALVQLANFSNVRVVVSCSAPETHAPAVRRGRPTDFMPRLLPSDVIYACGAPGMVETTKAIAASVGATCYADPFLPTAGTALDDGVFNRAKGWLTRIGKRPPPARSRNKRVVVKQAGKMVRTGEGMVGRHSPHQSA